MSQRDDAPLGERAEYRNSFYNPSHGHDPEIYKTDARPHEYRGYLIYNRIKAGPGSGCWDVVKDGVCIGQYAGKSGATGFIDRLVDGGASERELEKAKVTA